MTSDTVEVCVPEMRGTGQTSGRKKKKLTGIRFVFTMTSLLNYLMV